MTPEPSLLGTLTYMVETLVICKGSEDGRVVQCLCKCRGTGSYSITYFLEKSNGRILGKDYLHTRRKT